MTIDPQTENAFSMTLDLVFFQKRSNYGPLRSFCALLDHPAFLQGPIVRVPSPDSNSHSLDALTAPHSQVVIVVAAQAAEMFLTIELISIGKPQAVG